MSRTIPIVAGVAAATAVIVLLIRRRNTSKEASGDDLKAVKGGIPVLILGSGVNGLTTALMLALDGFEAHVISDTDFENTVSVGAGAIWEYPPFKVQPEDLSCRLALSSRVFLDVLAKSTNTGVRQLRAGYAWRKPPTDIAMPDWARADQITEFTHALLPNYSDDVRDGHWHRCPVLYMRQYLAWLKGACLKTGVQFHVGHKLKSRDDIQSVAQLYGLDRSKLLVVNCLGLGSAEVFGDSTMFPVKGQLAYVFAPNVIDVMDDSDTPDGLTYVIPQSDGVLGESLLV